MVVTPGQFLKCRHENSTKETNMTTQFKTKRASQTLFIGLIALCYGATLAPVHAQGPGAAKARTQYQVSDLPGLGGTNSSVTWNVKNTARIIVGISQTATPEPLGESWSSAAFYSPPNNVGYINLGFVWQDGQGPMRGLPNFPGGNNGFATGANNLRQAVGWAENDVHDP